MNSLTAQMNVQGNKIFDRFNFPECRDSEPVSVFSLLNLHQDFFSRISLFAFFHWLFTELINALQPKPFYLILSCKYTASLPLPSPHLYFPATAASFFCPSQSDQYLHLLPYSGQPGGQTLNTA